MDTFDECSVLIPTATLEDIGDGASDADARSLLAAWTALWHPTLLAQTEQIPTWYRADSPPAPDGPRVLAVPSSSIELLPQDYRRRCDGNPQCQIVEGENREQMLKTLGISAAEPADLEHQGRAVTVDDFFAAGYLSLQVQVMTRRLRYTSNLDEIFLQTRIVAAAKAFAERDAESAIASLHEVFDCLAEERDHYFSSDPHLIDLTLLTPDVLDRAIESGWLDRLTDSLEGNDEGLHAIPSNVLIDGAVAARIAGDSERYRGFREALQNEQVGWAGGGPADETFPLDAKTLRQAEREFLVGTELATSAIGETPKVYARLSGNTPSDLAHGLVTQGYCGVVPIDFAAGTGFGDEAKVLVSTGAGEIEAMTAKPIDAASDRAFLTLGAELGEAIDTGEVATGLLVHWPDRVCDSFLDLRRAATWGVAMGRFWTLDRYFRDGERPYHTASLKTLCKQAPFDVASAIDAGEQTLASVAESFCETVRDETNAVASSIARLANPKLDQDAMKAEPPILEALGLTPSVSASEPTGHAFCFNPLATGARGQAVLSGGAPKDQSFVYASSGDSQRCDVTFDIPAFGMTRLSGGEPVPQQGWLKRLTGATKGIAEAGVLRNEFMAVSFSDSSGGIEGTFSGSRGNRLSMRIVACKDGKDLASEMVAQSFEILESNATLGKIRSHGILRSEDGQTSIAEFALTYTLRRGRRLLEIEGEIQPTMQASESSIMKNYLAVRTAVADEAVIFRPIVREKVHSSAQRRMLAPLGVVLDESEKQTLIAAQGLPLHRKVGDRFLDTIVAPISAGEPSDSSSTFRLAYAFDSKHPVATARGCIAPPQVIALDESTAAETSQAWLVHTSPSEIVVSDLEVLRRSDGALAVRIQLVQPRPKVSRVSLRFCFDATAAFLLDDRGIDRPLDSIDEADAIQCEDGAVTLTLGSHQAATLAIVLKA